MNEAVSGYDLSRKWFDFCFENPEKIKPNHTALYFFAIEHCNRLGWKDKFGFPTTMVMEAIGIKSYNTYINTLKDLVSFGFIKMVEKSKNQYSANIIALSNNNKALDKALDKAFIKHVTKHGTKQRESNSSINKQVTNKQLTINQRKAEFKNSLQSFVENEMTHNQYSLDMLNEFFAYWTEHGPKDRKMRFEKEKSFGLSRRLSTWLKNQKRFEKEKSSVKKEKSAYEIVQQVKNGTYEQ